MGTNKLKTVDMSMPIEDEKVKPTSSKKAVSKDKTTVKDESKEAKKEVKVVKKSRERSKTYVSNRRLVDRTKFHKLSDAVALVKKTSYSKFVGTITADLVLKDQKTQIDIAFPHSTGQTKKVVIVDDALLKSIEKGVIDFDILIATPDFMPKIAKFARVLGPKGLMPNPKMGTVTTDPEKKKKELEGGKITLKTEKKAPLMHVVIGKSDMKDNELIENITLLIKKINPRKIAKLVISATMSPGVKIDLSEFIVA
jgi:large subunit ribosomal protein L1